MQQQQQQSRAEGDVAAGEHDVHVMINAARHIGTKEEHNANR
jgi:hypothetical protein